AIIGVVYETPAGRSTSVRAIGLEAEAGPQGARFEPTDQIGDRRPQIAFDKALPPRQPPPASPPLRRDRQEPDIVAEPRAHDGAEVADPVNQAARQGHA